MVINTSAVALFSCISSIFLVSECYKCVTFWLSFKIFNYSDEVNLPENFKLFPQSILSGDVSESCHENSFVAVTFFWNLLVVEGVD